MATMGCGFMGITEPTWVYTVANIFFSISQLLCEKTATYQQDLLARIFLLSA